MSSTNSSNSNHGTKTYFLTRKQINSSIENAINEVKSYTDSEISNLNKDLAKELEELESKISGIETFDTQVVNELPTVGEEKVLYLIPEVDDDGNVLETKIEYIWVNNSWELIGTTRVSLKGYATEEYANRVASAAQSAAEAKASELAGAAETAAKGYADTEIEEALKTAKGYTDTAEGNSKTYAEGEADQALADAKTYVGEQLITVNENIGKKLDTETYNSDKETLNQRLTGIESTNQTQATDITNLQTAISTKVEQEAYNSKIGDIEDVITELPNQYATKTLEETVTNLTKTVGDNKTAAETGIKEVKDGLTDKVTNDSLATTLTSYQTQDLTITDFDTEGVQATVESVLRSNNQAIINNTSAINTITQEIVGLQQTKSNRGEFWFNGGMLQNDTLKYSQGNPFSFAFGFRANKSDILGVTSDIYIVSLGFLLFYLPKDSKKIALYSSNPALVKYISDADNDRLLNGEWHSLIISYDGTTLKLTDEIGALLSASITLSSQSSSSVIKLGNNFIGQMRSIKYFNFDMSSDDAPYTIDDYIAGKEESPLLQGVQPVFNWSYYGKATKTDNTLDYSYEYVDTFIYPRPIGDSLLEAGKTYKFVFRSSSTSAMPRLYARVGDATKTEVSWQYTNLTTDAVGSGSSIGINATAIFGTTATTDTIESVVTIKPAISHSLYITMDGGTTLEAVSIQQVGTLLSLDDYTFNGKVFDTSGNNNDATITGNVKGSKDTSISNYTEEALKNTATSSQLTTLQNNINSQLSIVGDTLDQFDADISSLSSNIEDLQISKANSGVLYFNKGTLTCSRLQDVPVSFSMCRRFAFTKAFWDSIDTSTKDFYFDGSFDGYKGVSFCKGKSRKLGIGYGNGSGQQWAMIDLDETNSLMDGNVHSLVGIGANDELRVYVDNKLCSRTIIQSSSFTPERVNQIVDISGLYFDIYNFNFDMSDANAPYTIDDYISGKDVSPLLKNGRARVLDNTYPSWNIYNASNFALSKDSTADTLTATCITSNNYLAISEGYTHIAKAGDVISISWDSIEITTGIKVNSVQFKANGITVATSNNESHIIPKDSAYIILQFNFSSNVSVGDTITVKGLRIRVNGALLVLDDYSIEDKVLDISGNDNHATITGLVYGSKTSSVETFVNTVNERVDKSIDVLEDKVDNLSKKINIDTLTDTYISSNVESFTAIHTDPNKANIPGRILIHPKLFNVATIYVGENITDKTKAFPLYPDQIADFYFSDINNFKIACDASGDGCNYVIEWGVTNSIAIA